MVYLCSERVTPCYHHPSNETSVSDAGLCPVERRADLVRRTRCPVTHSWCCIPAEEESTRGPSDPTSTDSRPVSAYSFPKRRGHGHTPDVDGPITFDDMADDTIAFIEQVAGNPVRLLGCSDGAIVALLAALRRPDLVSRLLFAAGVFHYNGWHRQPLTPTTNRPSSSPQATPRCRPTVLITIQSSSPNSPTCIRSNRH